MTPASDVLARMRNAVDRVQANPQEVGAEARTVLEGLSRSNWDTELEAFAAWVAGLAAREENDLASAWAFMERALRAAVATGTQALTGRIRVSRALVLSYRGEDEAALAELEIAHTLLDGPDRGHALLQTGLILQRSGRLEDALKFYSQALPIFTSAGDRLGELRLRINRGVAHIYRGEFDSAESELVHSRGLAATDRQAVLAAGCAHNLGFLYGRRGDVPNALRWLETARGEYGGLGTESGLGAVAMADRAELLANAGLVTEALGDAVSARDTMARTDNRVELAESNLLVARVALAAGDYDQASVAAEDAARGFREQGRVPWAVLAAAVGFRARPEAASLARGLPHPGINVELKKPAAEATSLADALVEAGWFSDELTMRTLAGRLWLSAGDTDRALQEFRRVTHHRQRGSAAHRVLAWQAAAMVRLAASDRSGTRRAIRAGLRIVEEHRLTLAAADLRATVAASADELASWLVELALENPKPREVLAAAEAWRAGSLVAPVSPPPDAELERLLGRLRNIDEGQRQEGRAGANAERAELEAAVRDRARHLPAAGGRRSAEQFIVGKLVERVGDRLLVEFVECRGDLFVIWIANGVVRLKPAGDAKVAEAEARSARACLGRLATASGSPRSLAAAADTLAMAADRLAAQLLGPVDRLDGRPTIIVPTGVLHGVPWSALAPLADAPFVIAPSARSWMVADSISSGSKPGQGRMLLAAGPDLNGAQREVNLIAGLHRDAMPLTGERATAEAILSGMENAEVAHFAAHGTFRTDNPLLSSLRFADGNLTVYDIERVPRIPPTMVLSACDAAAVSVQAGNELLGFSATMLGLGAATVVAPMLPVADEVTAELLVELHRALAAGFAVPEALRQARTSLLRSAETELDGYRRRAAAGSFAAMGA